MSRIVIVDSYFVLTQQITLGRALSPAARDATVPQRVIKSACNSDIYLRNFEKKYNIMCFSRIL